MTSLPSPLAGSDSPIPGSSQQNVLVNSTNTGVGANVAQNNVYRPQGPQGKYIRYVEIVICEILRIKN